MTKGVVFLAPGQRPEVIKGIKDNDLAVVTASELDTDGAFGTPVGLRIKMEFKEVPNDLVASIRQSGRFSRQCIDLGSNNAPSFLFLIGYPSFKWIYDKNTGKRHYMLMNGIHETGLTYGEMQARFLTLYMIGIQTVWVPSWAELGETVANFYLMFQQAEHTSHLVRPSWVGHKSIMGWRKPGKGDLILHIYQGFNKVGYKTAKDLWKTFGTFRLFARGQQKHFTSIPGLGRVTANALIEALDAEYDDYFDEQGNAKQ